MKDVELVSQLLLLIEENVPKGYLKEDLDKAFSDRDIEWDKKNIVENRFKEVILIIKSILKADKSGFLSRSRLKNQAEFYSFFNVINYLDKQNKLPNTTTLIKRIKEFIDNVNNDTKRSKYYELEQYYAHTQSGINRTAARKERLNILRNAILGKPLRLKK